MRTFLRCVRYLPSTVGQHRAPSFWPPLDDSSSVLAHLAVQRVDIACCTDAEVVSAHQGVPQCVQRDYLDLTCPLSGDSKPVADLVQGLPRHAYAVVGADDDTFAITQSLCQLP